MVDRYLDIYGDRHYKEGGEDVYSVTTILDKQSGKNYGLEKWRDQNDGEGDNSDWRHLLAYKKNFGTLAHYNLLSPLKYPDNPEKALTDDEISSRDEINSLAKDNEVMYSLFKDRCIVCSHQAFGIYLDNKKDRLKDIFSKDMEYVTNQFEDIKMNKGISADTVTGVEKMFVIPGNLPNHKGFGGQIDLMYQDPDTGEHVVADLKTSKRVRKKHKLQVAAYGYAASKHPDLNGDKIDRCEIIRISPEQEESEVYEVDDWESYYSEFEAKARNVKKIGGDN